MGYNNKNIGSLSGSTCTKPFTISWTKLGREYLIGKKQGRKAGITVKFFALGDSDTNYYTKSILKSGLVPNITGVYDECINGNLRDDINFKVNLNKEGLILLKDYSIVIPKNTNSANGCPTSALQYQIYLNGNNILNTSIGYFDLLPQTTFNTVTDINNYGNSLVNSVLLDYQNITSFVYSYEVVPNTIIYRITGLTIKINNLNFTDSITDNSTTICNNVIQSMITFIQKTIIDPNFVENMNMNGVVLPDCTGQFDCSDYYPELVTAETFTLGTILDCIASEFDGWAG